MPGYEVCLLYPVASARLGGPGPCLGSLVSGAVVGLVSLKQDCPGSEVNLRGLQDQNTHKPPWKTLLPLPTGGHSPNPGHVASMSLGQSLTKDPSFRRDLLHFGSVNMETWATRPAVSLITVTRSLGLLWPLPPLGGRVSRAGHLSLL